MCILRQSVLPVVALCSTLLAGCVTEPTDSDAAMVKGKSSASIPAISQMQRPASAPTVAKNPAGVIRLGDILALALLQNPDLSATAYDIRAAEARTIQAGLRPNPEITAEIEDFGGTGERRDFGTAQTTLSLSQLIELGSKRMRRLQLARSDVELAGWDYEVRRLDVFVDTVRAFVRVLAAQGKVELAQSLLELDEKIYGTVKDRVTAGQVAPLEEQRAQVTVANSKINLQRERSEFQAARQRLSAMWGSMQPRFSRAAGDLADAGPIMPLTRLLSLAQKNPDLARWSAEIAQREAKLAVERSRDIPDVRIVGGARRYNDRNDTAFVAGVSVPLPVFGLNTGNVREAEVQLARGVQLRRAADLRVGLSIGQAYQRVAAAYTEISGLKRDVLPVAQAAADAARTGYQEGRFGLLQVIDAQRALAEARTRLIDAYAAYHMALADAERLTGQPLRRLDQSAK